MTSIPPSTNLWLANKVFNRRFPPTPPISLPSSITFIPAWVLMGLALNYLKSYHFPQLQSNSTFPILMAQIRRVGSLKLHSSSNSIVRQRTNAFTLQRFTWRDRPLHGFSGCTSTTSFPTGLHSYTCLRCDLIIWRKVQAFQPQTLSLAISLVELQEEKLLDRFCLTSKFTYHSPSLSQTQQTSSKPTLSITLPKTQSPVLPQFYPDILNF